MNENELLRSFARALLCIAVIAPWGGCAAPQDATPNVGLVLVDQLRRDTADEWLTATRATYQRFFWLLTQQRARTE